MLFDRAYPTLRNNEDTESVGARYCVDKYQPGRSTLGQPLRIEPMWVYALGLGRKNMDEAKAKILLYDGMSMKEFQAVFQEIKNDRPKIEEMAMTARLEFKKKHLGDKAG